MRCRGLIALLIWGQSVAAADLGTWGDLWPVKEPEMQKSLDSRVYFDQNGVLCQRLGIDQVPARVSAVPGDRFLKVEFIPAEEGRK
ncbi:TPA: hypothetical protein KL783_004175 [Escherichia coli]|nr:hypothetical protein [Escherichia coli]